MPQYSDKRIVVCAAPKLSFGKGLVGVTISFLCPVFYSFHSPCLPLSPTLLFLFINLNPTPLAGVNNVQTNSTRILSTNSPKWAKFKPSSNTNKYNAQISPILQSALRHGTNVGDLQGIFKNSECGRTSRSPGGWQLPSFLLADTQGIRYPLSKVHLFAY